MSLTNRYDFVLLFDVKDGNPNGDPDAGNLPRLDAETGNGLVTDVALKRKVRNFVALLHQYKRPHDIYVREKAVLGRSHVEAFNQLGISLGEEGRLAISEELASSLQELGLPDGLSVEEIEGGKFELVTAADIDKNAAQEWLKEVKPVAALKKLLTDAIKKSKGRRPTQAETESGRVWMCRNFFDIRTFGAVLSLKSAPNCGQVRGPVQLTFARSIDPVIAQEHSITRMAVATEAEAEKQGGDNRTMGRKYTIPYGLYMAHGFVSAFLAEQTGFGEDDLTLLWQALGQMFEHDRSAARGEMATRGLYVFKHESKLGNAPAHALFERIKPKLKDAGAVARGFDDYEVCVDETSLPAGVTLIRVV
jgi:CRISPR-associated protein Csd2